MGNSGNGKLKSAENVVRIGCMSRIDWGSDGYREGLLVLAQDVFKQEQPDLLIIAGGLISYPAIKKQLQVGPKREKEAELARLIEQAAQDLASALPKVQKAGEVVKTYIILSPSTNYDGPLGESVAVRLTELRNDIRLWRKRDERFPLHHVNKTMMVITPDKSQWATRYYSTPVERLIRDKEQQSAVAWPDFYVVGCFASNILKPKGEFLRPYVSLPALHRLEGVITAENQIGVKLVDVSTHGLRVHGRSFKDFMGPEYALLSFPKNVSMTQRKILRALIDFGPLTVGMLAREVASSYRKNGLNGVDENKWREKIQESVNLYQQNNFEPQILFDSAAQRYYISPVWFQKNLRYTLPKVRNFKEDSILAFGCLHAGATATDYAFFKEHLPRIILENDVRHIVCAGDVIIGLKHDLMLRGEVLGSLNVTSQEELAALLIGHVIAKVFAERLNKVYSNGIWKNKPPQEEDVKNLILANLPHFVFIPGNHDEWQEESGVTPLAFFNERLKKIVFLAVQAALDSHKLSLKDIYTIVEQKITALDITHSTYQLPSGLCMEITHPHMARAQTSSLRAQAMLHQSSCQMALGANFHVGIAVEEWNPEIGQRVAMLVGTFLRQTKFEKSKLKGRLDFGPGIIRVKSLDGRIFETEIAFIDEPTTESFDDMFVLKQLVERLGLSQENLSGKDQEVSGELSKSGDGARNDSGDAS